MKLEKYQISRKKKKSKFQIFDLTREKVGHKKKLLKIFGNLEPKRGKARPTAMRWLGTRLGEVKGAKRVICEELWEIWILPREIVTDKNDNWKDAWQTTFFNLNFCYLKSSQRVEKIEGVSIAVLVEWPAFEKMIISLKKTVERKTCETVYCGSHFNFVLWKQRNHSSVTVNFGFLSRNQNKTG